MVDDDYSTLVQLRARGYQVLVVIPDPVSFEESILSNRLGKFRKRDVDLAARVVRMERDLLLGRMQRAGVQVVEWNVMQPFDQAMRRASGWRRHLVHRL